MIRTYAARALRLGESPRVARPTPELAEWLVDHAHTVGCREPEVGNDAFDMGARRIDRDTWAKFTPLVAALKRRLKMPPPSGLERRMTWLCEALGLSRLETDLLGAAVRVALSKPVETLAGVCNGGCGGEVNKVGLRVLTGHDERAVKRALRTAEPLLLLGLLEDRGGGDVEPSPTVMRIARLETADPDRLRDALMGKSRKAELAWTDFAHLGEAADLAERFLAAALAKRTEGVNILLHGSPGTGKTEFARTLAERLGVSATFIGEIDEEEGEPTRASRVAAFAIGRSLAGRAGNTLLVVDEADDIFTGVDEDDAASRVGSKVFMNRLVERTPAPTVWITNHKERLGAAVLRRMSLAIRFPEPSRAVRRRVVERIAGRHRLRLPAAALEELSQVRASPAVIDAAVRLGKLTGGGRADIERAARSVIQAIEGDAPPPALAGAMAFDPALCEADCDLAALAGSLCESGEPAISLCLHGLPGTGKSAYARYLAARLGLDVIEKRASDLLSMWLGESEKQIVRAFADAADARALLIIDEADSLLRDRAGARASWEVTQVNEMLTWMERHPWPLVCTTNAMDALDPATMRRFLFKVRFLPMREDQAREAFRRAFGIEAPEGLDKLDGLTPGDFALVARKAKVLGTRDAAALVEMLADEVAAKADGPRRRIGF